MKTIYSLLLCSMFFFLACETEQPLPDPEDPKKDFEKEVNDPQTSAYYFTTFESANERAVSLSNPDLGQLIEANKEDSSFTVRYTKMEDIKQNTTELYKTEFVKADNGWSLLITDLTNKKVFYEKALSLDSLGWSPLPNGFRSLEACIEDFKCKHECVLQKEANRTCEPQYAGIICCLTNGQCFSIHFVFRPTSWRCRIFLHLPIENVGLAYKNQ